MPDFHTFYTSSFDFFNMAKAKLTEEDCKTIAKLLKERYKPRDLAKKYGVHMTTIYKRANYP